MKIEVPFSQLENKCPDALPTGTRLVAIPPTAAPSANGVMTEDTENIVSMRLDSRALDAPERSAYAAPRKMIPSSTMNNTTQRVDAIDPNALGYAVQNTVSTKISQTWFAS